MSQQTDQTLADALDTPPVVAPAVYDVPDVGGYGEDNTYAQPDYSQPNDAPLDNPQQTDTAGAPVVPPVDDTAARLTALEQQQMRRELEDARARSTFLEQQLAALQTQTPAQPTVPAFDVKTVVGELPQIDDATRATYAAADPYIQAIAKQAIADAFARYDQTRVQPLATTVPQFEQQAQLLQQQTAAQRAQMAANQVLQSAPWVTEERNKPAYLAYLNERLPGTAMTRGQHVNAALERGDAMTVMEILNAYPRPQASPLVGASSPGRQVPSATATQTPQRGFRYSTYSRALNQLANGEIKQEDFNKIEQQYYTALSTGTILPE